MNNSNNPSPSSSPSKNDEKTQKRQARLQQAKLKLDAIQALKVGNSTTTSRTSDTPRTSSSSDKLNAQHLAESLQKVVESSENAGDNVASNSPTKEPTKNGSAVLPPERGLTDSPRPAIVSNPPSRDDLTETSWHQKELEYKATIALLRSQIENVKDKPQSEKRRTWTLGNLLTINVIPPAPTEVVNVSSPTSPINDPNNLKLQIAQLNTQIQHLKEVASTSQAQLQLAQQDLDKMRKDREKERKDVEFKLRKVRWEADNKLELFKAQLAGGEEAGQVLTNLHTQVGQLEKNLQTRDTQIESLQHQLRERDERIVVLEKDVARLELQDRAQSVRDRSISRSRPSSPVKEEVTSQEELTTLNNKVVLLERQIHLLERKLEDQLKRNDELKELIVHASLGPSTPVQSKPEGDLVLANYAELSKQAAQMKSELDKYKIKNEEMSFVMGQLVEECERLERELANGSTVVQKLEQEADKEVEAVSGKLQRMPSKGVELAKTVMTVPTSFDLGQDILPDRRPTEPITPTVSTPVVKTLSRGGSTSLLVAKRLAGDNSVRPPGHRDGFVDLDMRMCCKRCGLDQDTKKLVIL